MDVYDPARASTGQSERPFVIHEPDEDPLRVQLVAAVIKYLRGAAATRSAALQMLDQLICAALDHEIGPLEIVALVAATINSSAKRNSPQADHLRSRYLRRDSPFWRSGL
jgi:hypothetical protein